MNDQPNVPNVPNVPVVPEPQSFINLFDISDPYKSTKVIEITAVNSKEIIGYIQWIRGAQQYGLVAEDKSFWTAATLSIITDKINELTRERAAAKESQLPTTD